jgi:hypothetical protein
MKRSNTLSLTASKTEYPTSKTINFLGAIQRPDLVKAYTRLKKNKRRILPLDLVKSGGTKQTRSASKMKNHIKDLADDFYSGIDYTQQLPMVFKNSKDYTIVIGEHRLQAFHKLGWKEYIFDVIDLDIEHQNVGHTGNEVKRWYRLISNRSNDHRTSRPPRLVETSSSIITDIEDGIIPKHIFKPGNEDLAREEILLHRPSASSNSVKIILHQVQTGTGGATSGTFMTLAGKDEAIEKAIECGFNENVHVCSHDMLNRYFFDILGNTTGDQELLVFVNSSNYSLSKEKLDNLRNNCIDSDHKHSLKTVKRQLRHIGVTDEEINRIKLPGFLPQGNQEPSTKLITLTNKQMLV